MYAVLRNEVNENEERFEKLKQENEIKNDRLRQLQIENDNSKKLPGKFDKSEVVANDAKAEAALKSKIDAADDEDEADFLKLSHEIALLEADLDKVNERKKNIQLINDQVGGWTRRVGEKLTEQVDPSIRPPDEDNIFKQPASKKLPLSIVFSSISQMVSA